MPRQITVGHSSPIMDKPMTRRTCLDITQQFGTHKETYEAPVLTDPWASYVYYRYLLQIFMNYEI